MNHLSKYRAGPRAQVRASMTMATNDEGQTSRLRETDLAKPTVATAPTRDYKAYSGPTPAYTQPTTPYIGSVGRYAVPTGAQS